MATAGTKALASQRPRAVLSWVPGYRREWLRRDVTAGLTSAAIVIPKAMACAVIAGMAVEGGLYTALAGLLLYPLLGTSRPLSVSTTSTLALMTAAAAAVMAQARPGVSPAAVGTTLALLVAGVMLLAGALRIGYLANFISTPVLAGFQAGAGAAIIVTQIGPALGVPIAGHSSLGALAQLPGALVSAHTPTVFLALGGIVLLVFLERRFPRLPAPLVLVALSILAAWAFEFGRLGVALVGAVPAGLPRPALPDLSLAGRLWAPALGLALMSLTETVAAARTFVRPDDPRFDPDRELTAVGAANLASSFLGGFPAGGGLSQTAVNDAARARSQLAEVVTGVLVVIVLLFLSPVIALLPKASLAALVIVVAASMIKPSKFASILRVRRDEFAWALVAALGVFGIGILEGVSIAVWVSLLTLLYQANHPPVYELAYGPHHDLFRKRGENPGDVTFPGLLLLRTEGRLYFANAFRVGERMWALGEASRPRVLVLDLSAVPDIEYTALMNLDAQVRKLRDQGVDLWLAAINPDLRNVIARSPLERTLGPGRMHPDLHRALAAYRDLTTRDGT